MGDQAKLNRFRRDQARDPWENPEGTTASSYSAVADLTDGAALAVARQYTHDHVVELTGANRLSGVRWRQIPIREPADLDRIREHLLTDAIAIEAEPGTEHQILGYLQRAMPNGALVVASVVVAQIPSRAGLS